MPYTIYQGTLAELSDILNGTFISNEMPPQGLAIGALTLIFTAPSAITVTFSGSAGDFKTPATIRSEVATAIAAATSISATLRQIKAGTPSGVVVTGTALAVNTVTGTSGFTISSTGTANALLGLSTTANTVKAPLAQSKIVSFGCDNQTARYTLVVAP